MSPLERRTRHLLLAYPVAWRRERGDELVGTVLDLAADDQDWPGPRTSVDLLVGGWRSRSRAHIRRHGLLTAGIDLAGVLSLLGWVLLAASWSRAWTTTAMAPLLPVVGSASAVTYLAALGAVLLGGLSWVLAWRPGARIAGAIAVVGWLATLGFQSIGGYRGVAWSGLVALTGALVLGARALRRPPTPAARLWVAITLTLAAVAWLLSGPSPTELGYSWGGHSVEFLGGRLLWTFGTTSTELQWLPVVWFALVLVALPIARVDARPIVASAVLLPVAGAFHVGQAVGPALVPGMVTAVVVIAVVGATLRDPTSQY